MWRVSIRTLQVAVTVAILIGCSHGSVSPATDPDAAVAAIDAPEPPEVPYPDPDWTTAAPGDVGLDAAKLDEAAAAAGASESFCLLVIRHGKLVSEHYFNGADATTTPPSWSIAKSYSSTVVGIAVGNSDLPGLDAAIADHIPEWQGTSRAAIKLRDLVSMDSGLSWNVFQDYIAMAELAPDKSAFAIGLDASAAPGTTWVYNNAAVQMIEPYFRAATGTPIDTYAQTHLWQPIGTTATWAHDAAGHSTTYANVMTTCRDHARLGYLYLHGGRWKHTQVVPAAYVAEAITPSQSYNRGYGHLFWLNGEAPTIDSLGNVSAERLQPYAPPDMFAAHGFGGQFIDVIPSLDLVVVRFALDELSSLQTGDLDAIIGALVADQLDDSHQKILQPILDAVIGP
jgi:CubicO group peptidase (beta-lactamase class C family)